MNAEKGGNGQSFTLSGEMYKDISEVLSDLASKTRAKSIIFADINGHPITQRGRASDIDIPNMTALAAGDFAATVEMSKMVGETQRFKYLYHEGEKTNIYLSSVADNFLLIVIFDTDIALGMIRIYTKRTIDKLEKILEIANAETKESPEFIDLKFTKYLDQELDKAFDF